MGELFLWLLQRWPAALLIVQLAIFLWRSTNSCQIQQNSFSGWILSGRGRDGRHEETPPPAVSNHFKIGWKRRGPNCTGIGVFVTQSSSSPTHTLCPFQPRSASFSSSSLWTQKSYVSICTFMPQPSRGLKILPKSITLPADLPWTILHCSLFDNHHLAMPNHQQMATIRFLYPGMLVLHHEPCSQLLRSQAVAESNDYHIQNIA